MRVWLRKYREAAGLSQKSVAQKVKITHQFYNYIENGNRRPSPQIAQRIAKALGFDWKLFYEEKDAG